MTNKVEQVKEILSKKHVKVTEEKSIPYGIQLKLDNGCVISCYDKGTIQYQGKNTDIVKQCIENALNNGIQISDSIETCQNVFVVYGHDEIAKVQLEAMLRRWDLNPLILDQLPTEGDTIIEKLEKTIEQASFGIVLATPDDIGYAKGKENEKQHRVRQNVVLELGMLLSKLGRKKVAILLSLKEEDLERPSDINGLLYMPFKDDVEEKKVDLAKAMNAVGYSIELENL